MGEKISFADMEPTDFKPLFDLDGYLRPFEHEIVRR